MSFVCSNLSSCLDLTVPLASATFLKEVFVILSPRSASQLAMKKCVTHVSIFSYLQAVALFSFSEHSLSRTSS